MKNKAIFLDRDGTINIDHGYVYRIEDFAFEDGVIEALQAFQAEGYKLIIITNQSGIARGYYTEDDFKRLHQQVDIKLAQSGITIDGLYYCPHLEGCTCRKPLLEMYYKAAQKFNVDFSKSYVIGDKLRDLALAKVEPVKAILYGEDKNSYDDIIVSHSWKEITDMIINP